MDENLFSDDEEAEEIEEVEESEPLKVSFPCGRCKQIINAVEYGTRDKKWYLDYLGKHKNPRGFGQKYRSGDLWISICFDCYEKRKKIDKTLQDLDENNYDPSNWDIEDKIEALEQDKINEEEERKIRDTSDPDYDPVLDPNSEQYLENYLDQFHYKREKEKERTEKINTAWLKDCEKEKTTWEYDQATGEEQQTIFPEVKPETNQGEFIGDLFNYEE